MDIKSTVPSLSIANYQKSQSSELWGRQLSSDCLFAPISRAIRNPQMAWVRPKHPPPKVPVDHTERNKGLLQYFSGKRARPGSSRIDRPQITDPTLQKFAQNKASALSKPPQQSKPESSQSSHRPRQHQEPLAVVVTYQSDPEEVEEEVIVRPPRRRVVERYEDDFAPMAPPRPRIPSRPPPSRVLPRRAHRDWESPERVPWEGRSTTSSRWASAITPLPGLV